ncbi:MAG TPA: replication initiator, partial [Frankiaceae bacterium]|nr:replication initiator [Frankiaceae bacterium]
MPASALGSPADDPALLESVLARVGRPGFEAWRAAVAHAGHCAHPVRLKGRVAHVDKASGAWRTAFDTAHLPDGVLLVGCGNRRATSCPECARIYAGDARRLVAAGLVGDADYLPADARPAGHPAVFVTATAPGFGAVHSRRLHGDRAQVCHPRRDACCAHGRPVGCWTRHHEHDPALGEPLCGDCYRYGELVVWNAAVPELWRRTTIYLKRALARRMGLSAAALAALVRPVYVKVGELQARGALHLHAVIRLDAATPDPDTLAPPPERFTAELLAAAVADALAAVRAPVPDPDQPTGRGLPA